jgi:hypothetical protein
MKSNKLRRLTILRNQTATVRDAIQAAVPHLRDAGLLTHDGEEVAIVGRVWAAWHGYRIDEAKPWAELLTWPHGTLNCLVACVAAATPGWFTVHVELRGTTPEALPVIRATVCGLARARRTARLLAALLGGEVERGIRIPASAAETAGVGGSCRS